MRRLTLLIALALLGSSCRTTSVGDASPGNPTSPPLREELYGNEFDVKATVTKKCTCDEPWHLEGTLTFPSGGWLLGKPSYVATRSIPPHVFIRVPVAPPRPDELVTLATVLASFQSDIPVGNEADFSISVDWVSPDELAKE